MHILRHYHDVPMGLRGGVYAIGNFDGVHRGHQAVIAETAAIADELGAPLGVLLFEPHPRKYFAPEKPFFRLTPFRVRAKLLAALGVDILAALPFDRHLAEKQAPDFVMDVLVNGLHVSHIVVGYDFRFGKGRTGDTTVLRYMGEMEGFGVTVVEEVKMGEKTFSSTEIRDALADGRPRDAAESLGHWWTVESQVVKGDQRGRTIGFPTANLTLDEHMAPKLGVYAVRIEITDGPHAGTYDGVANIGKRPTFDKKDVTLEVHIFDFDKDIYGSHAAVSLIEFIRPEQKFDGLDSLKAQIAADSARARDILAAMDAPRAAGG